MEPEQRPHTGSPRDPEAEELANSNPPPFPDESTQAPETETFPDGSDEQGRGGPTFTFPGVDLRDEVPDPAPSGDTTAPGGGSLPATLNTGQYMDPAGGLFVGGLAAAPLLGRAVLPAIEAITGGQAGVGAAAVVPVFSDVFTGGATPGQATPAPGGGTPGSGGDGAGQPVVPTAPPVTEAPGDEVGYRTGPNRFTTVLPGGGTVSQNVGDGVTAAVIQRPEGTLGINLAVASPSGRPSTGGGFTLGGGTPTVTPGMAEIVPTIDATTPFGRLLLTVAEQNAAAERGFTFGSGAPATGTTAPVTAESAFAARNAESVRRSGRPLCADGSEVGCVPAATVDWANPADIGDLRVGRGGVQVRDQQAGRTVEFQYCTAHGQINCIDRGTVDPGNPNSVGQVVAGGGRPTRTDSSGRTIQLVDCTQLGQVQCTRPGTNQLVVGGGRRPPSTARAGWSRRSPTRTSPGRSTR